MKSEATPARPESQDRNSGGDDIAGFPRAAVTIGAIHATSTLADYIWYPFLPLLAIELAGGDQTRALYWVSASWVVMGGLRILSGPAWGYLADRVGRKPMLMRSQISAMAAPVISVWLDAPWQLCILMGVVGLFSANMLAAVSLASVVVPPASLSRSLALMSGAQYIGMTVGPAIGAFIITGGGYVAAVLVSATLCGISALGTLWLAPSDMARARAARSAGLERIRPNRQLGLILLVQMALFAITYLLTIVSPVALKALSPTMATELTGIAFTFSGIGSAAGVLFLSGRIARAGYRGVGLALCSAAIALSLFLLAASTSVTLYIVGFTLQSLLVAAMMPVVNSLTALNVPESRRGTVFGLVASAQAAAFVLGPMAAALFAVISYAYGFVMVGVAFIILALLIGRWYSESIR